MKENKDLKAALDKLCTKLNKSNDKQFRDKMSNIMKIIQRKFPNVKI